MTSVVEEKVEEAVVEENVTPYVAPEYELSEDRSTKSRVTTIVGMFFAMLFAFGGIYMMGQAFDVPEQYAAFLFGGGVLVDAFGFWLAFWLVHRIDADNIKKK